MINTAVIGKYKGILVICQKKKKHFVALRNFNIGLNGKPEMWNISKTADRRAKRTKNLGLGVLQCTYVGYF